jgi:CRP-like cAMP-binding protein
MIQQIPQLNQFKEQMQGSLLNETKNSKAIKIRKHNNVYTAGDQRETVYFIEKGQIKLVMASEEGKECLLAIRGAGDVFGALCLSGLGGRLETATAMEDCSLKEIPAASFWNACPGTLSWKGSSRPHAEGCRPAAGHRQFGDS